VPAGFSETKVSEQDRAQLIHKQNAALSHRIWTILPQNFANWSAEFGKILRGKPGVLVISGAID